MEKELTYGGYTHKSGPLNQFPDEFKLEFDWEDTEYFISKEEFHHEEDEDLDFKYRYVVELKDVGSYSEGKGYLVTLFLCVSPESLCESNLHKVASCCGIDTSSVLYADIVSYGLALVIQQDIIDYGVEDIQTLKEFIDDPNIAEILYALANTYRVMDRLRGFHFDRRINMIGTTGWDVLWSAVYGTDMFQPALDRATKHKEAV